MLRAFSTAATGMAAQQTQVDVIANNLANVNTTGFKRSQVDFKDLLYTKMIQSGMEVSAGFTSPGGLEVGNGVRVAATPRVQSAGELENTGRKLDVAIQGDGFFQVTMPNGDIRYTRDGSLHSNASGQLVTAAGYPLQPAITLPTDARDVEIGADGSVNSVAADGTMSVVGTLQLVKFPNPEGLSGEGNNLMAETQASGAP